MHWFRSRAGLGSWLALVALALQLVFTFGHVHLDSTAPRQDIALASTPSPSAPTVPAAPDGANGDHCATCALIHLAGSLVPAESPVVPLPVAFERPRPEPADTLKLIPSEHARFRARAPPAA